MIRPHLPEKTSTASSIQPGLSASLHRLERAERPRDLSAEIAPWISPPGASGWQHSGGEDGGVAGGGGSGGESEAGPSSSEGEEARERSEGVAGGEGSEASGCSPVCPCSSFSDAASASERA